MTLIIVISMFISLTISLIMATSPISMGLWVLLIALTASITINMMLTKWLSFLIFLIYIGGLLVMFAYFSATAPNQQLSMFSLSMMLLYTLIISLAFMANIPILAPSSTKFMPSILMIQLFTMQNSSMLIFMALILFFALVAVVKISILKQGPLRPFTPH